MSTVRIGLIGLGTVGSAVVEQLHKHSADIAAGAGGPVELVAVAVNDLSKPRSVAIDASMLTANAETIINDPDLDIVVEVMGGTSAAHNLIKAAINCGKYVVSANKAVIARWGPELAALAQNHNSGLWFEAAVGGSIPIINALCSRSPSPTLHGIDAVINGTTNFMLTEMESGSTYEAALEAAQRRGYAEADPSTDVDGLDAADKLAIMTWLGWGIVVDPAQIATRGIRDVSAEDLSRIRQTGSKLRLVAHAELNGCLSLSVHPTVVDSEHIFATLMGTDNAVRLIYDQDGDTVLCGAGAGGGPTAQAVISDIIEAAQTVRDKKQWTAPSLNDSLQVCPRDDSEEQAYLRITVSNNSEAINIVSQMLEDRSIRVKRVVEGGNSQGNQLLIFTNAAPRNTIDHALETLDALSVVEGISDRWHWLGEDS